MSFDPPRPIVRALVEQALAEDLGVLGDITSIACVAEDQTAVAAFVARDEGVLAGTALATETFAEIDQHVAVTWLVRDGEVIEAGTKLGEVSGPLRSILTGERVALNCLCHCSGVASATRRFVRAARGKARIRDTRKTLPGMRAVQKAAVRAGGGFNHRDSLSDAVLIKDNHLAAVGLKQAVDRAKVRWPARIIEVECDSPEQVTEALNAGVDLILLDNMTPDECAAVSKRVAGAAKLEVSGRISIDSVGDYADAGVDFISVGAITHSVRTFDIGLDIL